MASKYDVYWSGQLDQIRAALQPAAAGTSSVIELPGLRRLGARQSWYGVAEVCGRDVTRSSMAHAASLGRTVAASGICERWPDRTFRFAIDAAGELLTVTTAEARRIRSAAHPIVTGEPVDPAAPNAKSQEPVPPAPSRRGGGQGAGNRQADADEFYRLLEELARRVGGKRWLRDARGTHGWPRHGVYFFFEDGEVRANGSGRVVRVSTHALTAASRATLWGLLRQHRGQVGGRHPGGGDHHVSIFRGHVGSALIRRGHWSNGLLASWSDRHGPIPGWATQEAQIEQQVSDHIRAMPFVWLDVTDRADRNYIERHSIALLSYRTGGVDPPSPGWLGHHATGAEIRESGLWNVEHVNDRYDPGFLRRLAQLVKRQQPPSGGRAGNN